MTLLRWHKIRSTDADFRMKEKFPTICSAFKIPPPPPHLDTPQTLKVRNNIIQLHSVYSVYWFQILLTLNSHSSNIRTKLLLRCVCFLQFLHRMSAMRFEIHHDRFHLPSLEVSPRIRILLHKRIGCQLVSTFPAFYNARMFTMLFERFRHWTSTWGRLIQSVSY